MKSKASKAKIVILILVLLSLSLLIMSCIDPQSKETLTWNEKESSFVDYSIDSDRIRFSYTLSFTNHTDEDQEIAVSAKFKHFELENWIEDEGFFIGEDENGEIKYVKAKAKSTGKLTVFFEGKYLGGKVKTDLSFPEEIMIVMK